jgi:hypothetical protein
MDSKRLIELRKEAEKAVAEMPDGELKLKAFEVILNHLIASGLTPPKMERGGNQQKPTGEQPNQDDVPARSVAGRLMVLREEGFFKNPKALAEIREELQAHGWHYPNATIAPMLIKLCQKQTLRRQRMKEGEARPWKYFNP